MASLQLRFIEGLSVQLAEASFCLGAGHKQQNTVRGRTSGAFPGYGAFQWSSAVGAFSVLLLKYAATRVGENGPGGILVGSAGSLAASLDYAIDKGPAWLIDMFGVDCQGRLLARRAFLRTNPGRKRPGPVVIAINSNFLPVESVKIALNGVLIAGTNELANLAKLVESELAIPLEKPAQRRAA